MADPTLTYRSCERWMELAVWAKDRLAQWQERTLSVEIDGKEYYIQSREGKTAFFREVAQQAKQIGFSITAGNRIQGFRYLMRVLDPEDVLNLYSAAWQINKAEWL
jgi:hypothetical protein